MEGGSGASTAPAFHPGEQGECLNVKKSDLLHFFAAEANLDPNDPRNADILNLAKVLFNVFHSFSILIYETKVNTLNRCKFIDAQYVLIHIEIWCVRLHLFVINEQF